MVLLYLRICNVRTHDCVPFNICREKGKKFMVKKCNLIFDFS